MAKGQGARGKEQGEMAYCKSSWMMLISKLDVASLRRGARKMTGGSFVRNVIQRQKERAERMSFLIRLILNCVVARNNKVPGMGCVCLVG